jgi:outer membrane protein OmpA-like peptidoglycan-associated protein
MIESTEQGVRLSLRDIRFVADSAEILPEEQWRLDAIAETLRAIPGGKFLVEGHTANVGNPSGEKKLSTERAEHIIRELSRRGISEDSFKFTGYGGTLPVADNATPEGRAQNRRVEITILE